MWKLAINGPMLPPRTRDLGDSETVMIGRASDNDLVFPSDCISRRHARIDSGPEGLSVRDLGSRNGTRLNGQALGQVSRSVEAGDVISFGDFVIKVEPVQDSVRSDFVTLFTRGHEGNPYVTSTDWRAPPLPSREPASATEYAPLLFHLAERLASGHDPSGFLWDVLACARAVTGYQGGLLLRGAEGELSPAAPPGPRAPARFQWSKTLVDAAFERRATLSVNQLQTDPRFNSAQSVILAGHLHVICSPLVGGDRVFGALYLFTRALGPCGQATVDFISSIGRLGATALLRGLDRLGRSESGPWNVSERLSNPLRRASDDARFVNEALGELDRALATTHGEARLLLEETQAAARRIEKELRLSADTAQRLELALGSEELSEEGPTATSAVPLRKAS